ncbi:MAG: UvrB/UvrC motif-containing protein [Elusimicrobiota bacterium]
MLCEQCHKADATVFFKQLLNNQVTELRLCGDCAKKIEVPALTSGSPIFDLLASLAKATERPGKIERLACSRCGLQYLEFRRTGLLGCPQCYDSFAKPLEELLKQIHGKTRHRGKMPPGVASARSEKRRTQETARLRKQLETAVKDEAFEEAARIRDMLKRLEK